MSMLHERRIALVFAGGAGLAAESMDAGLPWRHAQNWRVPCRRGCSVRPVIFAGLRADGSQAQAEHIER
jgi:hypothetical protein